MKGKIELTVRKGGQTGKTFTYTEQERVFIGRQTDCAIVFPENTVSRYHCLLDIQPPRVVLQDFGSLNGTYINGNKIGQRNRDQSWEEARALPHDEFELRDGDVLGLGKSCELSLRVTEWETCPRCGAVLPPPASGTETVYEDGESAGSFYDSTGRRICRSCWEEENAERERLAAELRRMEELRAKEEEQRRAREEEERKQREAEEKQRKLEEKRRQREQEKAAREAEEKRLREEEERRKLEEEERAKQEEEAAQKKRREDAERLMEEMRERLNPRQRKCAVCGKSFTPTAPDNNLCPDCMQDEARQLLEGILAELFGAPSAGENEADIPSLPEGFDKVSLLGRGGMGEVWKVRERSTGKCYALKTMLPKAAADEHSKKLFLREAGICEVLDHRNVVRGYKTGCANGVFYILMDLCEGGSVDSLMEKWGGRLPLNLATYIILQALSGLDYVHNMDLDVSIRAGLFRGTKEVSARGAVHRDIKPGNIFLSDSGDHPVAKVADFGMAKAFSTAGLSNISKSGSSMGTPVFMPRQQVMDCKYAKPEVDVWAAAASYYNMITGEYVRNFRSGKNAMQIIVMEKAVPIRARDPSVPPRIAAVIDKALQEDPAIGYQTAAEFRRELVAALTPELRSYCRDVLE